MSNVVKTSLTEPLVNGTVYEDKFIYKGEYQVVLDIGSISERNNMALNVTIDWGDGTTREVYRRDIIYDYRSNSIFSEVLNGTLGGSILGQYEHRYEPTLTHIRELSAQVIINFADGKYTKIVQPIALIMESYYDNIQEFLINSIAVHDKTLFSIINLQSKYNDRAWPAIWVDTSIFPTSVFPPEPPEPPVDPPVEPPPRCQVFQCTGDPNHPSVDCPPGFTFNCWTCKCEKDLPPDYPPCNYPINYPCYPLDSYASYPCKYPPLCYSIDPQYADDNGLILDPFGFNQLEPDPES